MKLGGKLIGYDIEHNGILKNRVRFELPIKNTIVQRCLDNLLTYNGTSDLPPSSMKTGAATCLFFHNNNSSSGRWGVFNYCALGNGTGATDVEDTDLKNRITEYVATKKGGSGYCGTYKNTTTGVLSLRISHSIEITTEAFEIKEIGYYNRYWGTDDYDLSSRIILDSPIQVDTGDIFTPIYQIDIKVQEPEIVVDFFGLGAVKKVCGIHQNPWGLGVDNTYSIPTLNESGNSIFPINQGGAKFNAVPAYSAGEVLNEYSPDAVIYACFNQSQLTAFDTPLNTFGINDSYWYYSNGNVSQRLVKSYTLGSFYRDVTYKLSPDWFAGRTDLYALYVNGTVYEFGTIDENDVFTNAPITKPALEEWTITTRQSWSTDLLTPTA